MVVDLAVYRARVGTFKPALGRDVISNIGYLFKAVDSVRQDLTQDKLDRKGAVAFIDLLLRLQGIEPNPGPRDEDGQLITQRESEDNMDRNMTVAVVGSNLPIVQSESNCCIAIGNTGIIRCQILGEVGRVLWKKRRDANEHFNDIAIDNNKYIGGSVASPSLVIEPVSEEDAGKYICQAENSAGVAQSAEIEVRVTKDNVSVMPAMCNHLMEVVQSTQTTNLHLTLIETANNSIIGNNGLVVNQGANESDNTGLLDILAEKSSAAQDVVKRFVEAFGEISDFRICCQPDIREIRVHCTIMNGEPNSTLRDILQKQIATALNAEERIVNIELIKHCIIISFDITGAKFPWEMSALTLAERFRSGVEDGSISLTDESGHALSIYKDSTRIELKDTSDNTDKPVPGVPLVSIGQSGYMVPSGEISVLKCTALSSVPVTSVRWFRINKEDQTTTAIEIDNNKYFGGSTESPSLVINDTIHEDEGLYLCRAENANGVGESPPVVLGIFENTQILQKLAEALGKSGSSSYVRQSETPLPEIEEMDDDINTSKMAAKREIKTEDINEEVIFKHNLLVDHLSVHMVEDDFQSLIKLFTDCPLPPKDLINITTVHELFVKLKKNENISIGHYEYFTEQLKKVDKSLASYVRREEQEIRDILNAGLSPAKRLRTEQECIQQYNSGGPPVSDQTAGSSSHSQKIHSDLLPMIETTISMIKTEKEKEIQFMPTKAYHDAQEKLRKNRVLVIKGNTGDGKTSTAFQLIHWLMEEEQQCRTPLQLHKIEKLDLLAPNSDLACFIDDIFGERDIGRLDVQEWNKRLKNVETLFVCKQNQTNYLIITIRNEIFNVLAKNSRGTVFTKDNIIDLSSNEYKIKGEKQNLLAMYTPTNLTWTEEEEKKIVGYAPHIGFPQCCQLFYNSAELQEKRAYFFEKPVQFFIEALSKLPECSAILFLFLNDGEIKVNDLDLNGGKVDQTLLEQAFNIELVESEDQINLENEKKQIGFVRKSLDKLLGFLVRKEKYGSGEEVYRFHHDSIYVTVALLYGKKTPVGYIKHCPKKALSYLTTVETSTDMVVISPGHYNDLCERLLREFESVKKYDYETVIGSLDVWKEFVEIFDKYLNKKKVNKLNILNKACDSGSAELALYLLKNGVKPDEDTDWWALITRGRVFDEGYLDILKEIVVYLNDEMKQKLLNEACQFGSSECVMYLLSVGVKPDKDTYWWRLITRGRVYGEGDLDILKEIVVYLNDEMKQKLLNEACWHGSSECVMYLLSVGVKPDNDTDWWGLIIRGRWSGEGGLDILKEIVVYLNDEMKQEFLNTACESGSSEYGMYLISVGAKPDEDTMLHVAMGGSVDLYNTVRQYVVIPTWRDEDGMNVLHLACLYNRVELSTVLCQDYPHLVHGTDWRGRTPLHEAAWTGNCSMFQTVEKTVLTCLCRVEDLHHKCEKVDEFLIHRYCVCSQYMCQLVDRDGGTVLHVSCEEGQKDLCLYICRSYPAMTACRDSDGSHCLHYIAVYTTDVDWFIEVENVVRKHLESLHQHHNIKTLLDGRGRSVLDLAKERTERLRGRKNPLYEHLLGVFSK